MERRGRRRRSLADQWQRFKSRVTPSNSRGSLTPGSVKKKTESLRLTEVNYEQPNGSSQNNGIFSVGDQRQGSLGESGRENGESSFASPSVAVDIELNGSVHPEEIRPASGSGQPPNGSSSGPFATSSTTSVGLRRRAPAPHVAIDVASGMKGDDEAVEPTYFESHLNISYLQCLSPLRLEGYSGGIWGCSGFFGRVQQFLFGNIAIISILLIFGFAKLFFLSYFNYGKLDDFTRMCLYAMGVLTQIYFSFAFTFQQAKLMSAVKQMRKLRMSARQRSLIKEPKYSVLKLLVFVLVSQTISILSVVFVKELVGWTPEKGTLIWAYQMAKSGLIWTPASLYNNGTGTLDLKMTYGTNLTTTNIILGIAGILAQILYLMLTDAMDTLLLVTAITLQRQTEQLAKELENPDYDIDHVTLENFMAPDGPWEHLLQLKKTYEEVNLAINDLLKYWHISNLSVILFLLLEAFDGDLGMCLVLYYVFRGIKICVTYRMAAKASQKNETYRRWIRRLMEKSNDPKFIVKAFTILDELKEEPIGLGRGIFLIDENFLSRFFGTAGSVFVLQADHRE